MLLNKLYILINNIFYHIIKYLNEKIRKILIFICCFSITFLYLTWQSNLIKYPCINGKYNFDLILLVLLTLLMILGFNYNVKKIKWNLFISIPYQIVSIIMLIYSIKYKHDSFIYLSLESLLLFPCIYIGWSNIKNYSFLFDSFAFSFMMIGFLYYVECFHFATHGLLEFYDGRLMAQTSWPNVLGFIEMMNGISSIYLANKHYKNKLLLIICIILFGPSLVLIKMASSRSTYLSIIVAFVCFFVFNIKKINKENYINKIIKIIVIIFLFYFSFRIYNLSKDYLINTQKEKSAEIINEKNKIEEEIRKDEINETISNNASIKELPEEYFIAKIGIVDGVAIEVERTYSYYDVEFGPITGLLTPLYSGDVLYISISSELGNENYIPIFVVENAKYIDDNTYIVDNQDVTITTGFMTIDEKRKEDEDIKQFEENYYNNALDERMKKINENLDSFFAGRLRLWNFYINKLTLGSHDFDELTKKEFKAIRFNTVTRPHNNYLEIAYRYGIQFGLLYGIWVAVCCVLACVILFRKRYKNSNFLYIIIICATFFIQSMIEQSLIFCDQQIVLLFYICISPLIIKKKNVININSHKLYR